MLHQCKYRVAPGSPGEDVAWILQRMSGLRGVGLSEPSIALFR